MWGALQIAIDLVELNLSLGGLTNGSFLDSRNANRKSALSAKAGRQKMHLDENPGPNSVVEFRKSII